MRNLSAVACLSVCFFGFTSQGCHDEAEQQPDSAIQTSPSSTMSDAAAIPDATSDARASEAPDASVLLPMDASSGRDAALDGGFAAEAGSVDASHSLPEAADAGPFPNITFAGLVSALELAPIRLAANGIYPAKINITSGGVDNLFSAGGALLATNAETQALRASVQHPNLRIIFTVCEGLYRIVAKKSSGIHGLADLRGKTLAVPTGTSSEYFLSKMLALAGLTERDLTLSSQLAGRGTLVADAATVWEPGIQYVASGLGSDAVEFEKDDQGHEVYRELFNLHATAESLADPTKRRAIVQFVRALITASERIRSDPSQVWPLLTAPTGASQAELEKSWPYERFAGTLVSDVLDVLEQEEPWRAQLDARRARTRAELAPLVDDSVLHEALGM
jgi:NitT/TauT family transport system substrate-binding protein